VPLARPRQPVRIALAAFVAIAVLSYAVAQARGLPSNEVSPADSGLVRLVSWSGIVLVANDGITGRDRLVTLLHRITVLGGAFAVLGLLQFFTGQSLIADLALPGLSVDPGMSGIQIRGGFTRSSATASHPLEYAVVLSATLPLAMTFALEKSGLSAIGRSWATVATAVATVLSVSRSAIVGVVTALAVMAPTWSPRVRRSVLAAAAALAVAVYVFVPGVVGTLRGLFVGASDDPSTTSRTSSYDIAFEISSRYLIVGRGPGTFLPAYRILDNQILGLLIEMGIVGLTAFLVLVGTAIVAAIRSRRLADRLDAQLRQAIAAAITATTLLFAFFDALSFPMAGGVFFLLIGLAGAAANVQGRSSGAPGTQ